jgi:UDP-glucose 4-epimerase
MRYLVTGGAGFIGSHLVEGLIGRGDEVIVIDDFSTGSRDNLAAVLDNPALDLVEGDILNLPELEYLIGKVDMVYHLAAAVGVELVVHDPVRTIVTNVHGTERVLQGAARKGTLTLIASTSEVYGKSEHERFSEGDDLLIGPPTHSRWSYACSKLLDEFYAMAFHRSRNLPVIVSRFFNTVGPRQTGRYGMVLPRFVQQALAGKPLQVYGDGLQSRCFCHVADTVRALLGLSGVSLTDARVFNIGSTREVTIGELARMVIERVGSTSAIDHVPYEKAYEEGFEDMRRRYPDTRAIEALIGWRPERSLEQVIDDVTAFHRGRQ